MPAWQIHKQQLALHTYSTDALWIEIAELVPLKLPLLFFFVYDIIFCL